MQTSVPDAPTAPTLIDWVLMMAVAVTSFGGQLVLGRAYQIEVASKVAAVNYLQASSIRSRAGHMHPALCTIMLSVGHSSTCFILHAGCLPDGRHHSKPSWSGLQTKPVHSNMCLFCHNCYQLAGGGYAWADSIRKSTNDAVNILPSPGHAHRCCTPLSLACYSLGTRCPLCPSAEQSS